MRRILPVTVTLLLLALAGLLAPGRAGAAESPRATGKRVSVADRDDTSSRLDLRRVSLRATQGRIVARFAAYGPLRHTDLDGANGLHLRFGVGTKRYREVLVWSLSRRWVATICTGHVGRTTIDRHCSRLRVHRDSARVMRVEVPRQLIRPGARVYRWHAWSEAAFRTAGCAGEGISCDDHVGPARRYLRWRP